MSGDDLTERRKAYDRRARAWVFLVFGILAVWIPGFGGLGSDQTAWSVVGYVAVTAGAGLVVAALVLFQKPRP